MKRIIILLVLLLLLLGLVWWFFNSEPEPDHVILPQQKIEYESTSLKLMTWNAFNFGKSKSESEIDFFAKQMKAYDIVTIQEVSTGNYGAKAVAQLADNLNRTGAKWDYVISEGTSGDGSERYAFLWKPSRVKLTGNAWLESSLENEIDREPFLARFQIRGESILLASFHAVPTSKNPESECELLVRLNKNYPDDNIMIMGDFNLSEKSEAFDDLKKNGFEPAITDQKTSLKMKESNNEHLANEYDNIFYESKPIQKIKSGVIDFSRDFTSLKDARTISDHVPVYLEFLLN